MRIIPGPKAVAPEVAISVGALVEYEQHGKSILGAAVESRKAKWNVLNERGQELELPPERLHRLPGNLPPDAQTRDAKCEYLQEVSAESLALAAPGLLADVWEVLLEEPREYSTAEIADYLSGASDLRTYLAVRRALQRQQPYFKRLKFGFEPRPAEVVEALKEQYAVEAEREAERESLINALIRRMKDGTGELPRQIAQLEEYAALGGKAERAKEMGDLIEEVAQRMKIEFRGKSEQKAFDLLIRVNHFTIDQDLELIRMRRSGRFRDELIAEAERIVPDDNGRVDARAIEVLTIDSADTQDIDDGVSLEETTDGFRLGIHISDVAAFVRPGSMLWEEAIRRASSIYTPDYRIPMFPEILSTNMLSLLPGEERRAVSVYLELDTAYSVRSRKLERSLIRATKLSYDEVDRVLYGESSPLPANTQSTLQKLWEIVCAFERKRIAGGAIQFNRRELNAVVVDGNVTLEEIRDDLPGRKLVGELMIAANESTALYGKEHNLALVYRGQEPPEVDIEETSKQVLEGPAREYFMRGLLKRSTITTRSMPHSGLGLDAYIQSTSPIRRVGDLLNQRQVVTHLESGVAQFSEEEVRAVLERIETGAEEVFLLQRGRNRYWLQRYLLQQHITELDGVIVRVDGPKPLIELDGVFTIVPFVPRKESGRSSPERLGEKILIRIAKNDPRNEYFVLEEVGPQS